jgi:hypothetical protein
MQRRYAPASHECKPRINYVGFGPDKVDYEGFIIASL